MNWTAVAEFDWLETNQLTCFPFLSQSLSLSHTHTFSYSHLQTSERLLQKQAQSRSIVSSHTGILPRYRLRSDRHASRFVNSSRSSRALSHTHADVAHLQSPAGITHSSQTTRCHTLWGLLWCCESLQRPSHSHAASNRARLSQETQADRQASLPVSQSTSLYVSVCRWHEAVMFWDRKNSMGNSQRRPKGRHRPKSATGTLYILASFWSCYLFKHLTLCHF